jgi:hypothetical protein
MGGRFVQPQLPVPVFWSECVPTHKARENPPGVALGSARGGLWLTTFIFPV